jgi:hypothetical protein
VYRLHDRAIWGATIIKFSKAVFDPNVEPYFDLAGLNYTEAILLVAIHAVWEAVHISIFHEI